MLDLLTLTCSVLFSQHTLGTWARHRILPVSSSVLNSMAEVWGEELLNSLRAASRALELAPASILETMNGALGLLPISALAFSFACKWRVQRPRPINSYVPFILRKKAWYFKEITAQHNFGNRNRHGSHLSPLHLVCQCKIGLNVEYQTSFSIKILGISIKFFFTNLCQTLNL